MMEKKIRLKTVNPCITCHLCKGYLIDATTITECLHTFCKSCIVNYLDENKTCPKCHILIHQSYPLNFISFDRTMQDIVYKLVPNLQENEKKRQMEYYKSRNLPLPKNSIPVEDNGDSEAAKDGGNNDDSDFHRSEEQVTICLECKGNHLKHIRNKYLRISSQATVHVIKKYVALKLHNSTSRHKEIDILCNEEILGKDHTLKFVLVTRWRSKDGPLLLHYSHKLADL